MRSLLGRIAVLWTALCLIGAAACNPKIIFDSFTATPSVISVGSSSTLAWHAHELGGQMQGCSSNEVPAVATSTVISSSVDNARDIASGSTIVKPASAGLFTYHVSCTDVKGKSLAAAPVSVQVGGGAQGHFMADFEDGDYVDKTAALAAFENYMGMPPNSVINANYSYQAFSQSSTWGAFATNYTTFCNGQGPRNSAPSIMINISPGGINSNGDAEATAAGAHDSDITSFANGLAACRPNAIIRPAWEFNCCNWPWAVSNSGDADTYRRAFRRVAMLFKAASPGFRIFWCPNQDQGNIDPSTVYPGDDVVDIIGFDLYTNSTDPVNGTWHLNDYTNFANSHGKPLGIGELGISLDDFGGTTAQKDASAAAWTTTVCNWIKNHNFTLIQYFEDAHDYHSWPNPGQTENAFINGCVAWALQ